MGIIKESWAEKDPKILAAAGKTLTLDVMDQQYYRTFIGSSKRAIIRTNIVKDKVGGTTRLFFKDKLTGTGVSGNSDFKDNTDNQTILYQDVDYEIFGDSLESKIGEITDKESCDTSKASMKEDLTDWAATEFSKRIDIGFTADCTHIIACKDGGIYTGTDSKTDSIKPGDVFSAQAIKAAKKHARSGKTPAGKATPRIRPFRVYPMEEKGVKIPPVELYVMIIGPQQAEQLGNDPEWIEAQKHAGNRGVMNKLFTGAYGIYDGVVIYDRGSYDYNESGIISSKNTAAGAIITNLDDYSGAAGIETEIALFLGAQAGLMPQDEGFMLYEEVRDMGRKIAIGIGRGLSFAKSHFKADPKKPHEVASVYNGNDMATIAVVSSMI
jgi:hypothetical protein